MRMWLRCQLYSTLNRLWYFTFMHYTDWTAKKKNKLTTKSSFPTTALLHKCSSSMLLHTCSTFQCKHTSAHTHTHAHTDKLQSWQRGTQSPKDDRYLLRFWCLKHSQYPEFPKNTSTLRETNKIQHTCGKGGLYSSFASLWVLFVLSYLPHSLSNNQTCLPFLHTFRRNKYADVCVGMMAT